MFMKSVCGAAKAALVVTCAGLAVPALAQPANDRCDGAPTIASPSSTSGSNVGATSDVFESSCSFEDALDVWYSFTATVAGAYTFDTIGSPMDTTLSVFADCGGVELGCDDDIDLFNDVYQSELTVALAAGQSVRVRVAGYDSETGSFTLHVSAPAEAAANDLCANAIPFTTALNVTVNNDTATADGPTASCSGGAVGSSIQNSIWYTITPAQPVVLTGSVDPTNYDGTVVIYTGACGSLAPIFCGDQPEPIVVNAALSAGTTYYIAIGDWGTSEGGGNTVINLNANAAFGPTVAGAANPGALAAGGTTLLTVNVTPGSAPNNAITSVFGNLSSIGGSASQAFFNNGTNGDAVAGDSVWSVNAVVALGTPGGLRSVPFTATDAQARTAGGSITVRVTSANDACADAVNLNGAFPWSATIDNSLATADGLTASCSGGTATSGVQNSVWYSITPSTPARLSGTIDPTTYDGVFVIYTGSCASLTPVYCADEPEPMSIGFTLEAGTTYLLAIGDWGTGAGGGSTVVSLQLDGNFGPQGTGLANPDQVGAGQTTLLTVDVNAGSAPNNAITSVTADLSAIGGSATQAFSDSGTGGDAVAGDTVWSYTATVAAGSASGDIALPFAVTDAQGRTATGEIELLVAIGNDLCSAAVPIVVGTMINGSTEGATGSQAASCSISTEDVWYDLTAPVSATYTFTTTTTGTFENIIALYPDCSQASGSEILCANLEEGDPVPAAALSAGQNVKVRISNYADGTGAHTLLVTSDVPVGSGACCSGTTCSVVSGASACASGSYRGDGSACSADPLNPTTCCPANFDATGGVNVSDIFSFLSAWFAQTPASDFNHDAVVNVSDIFSFLSAWFAGC